MGISDVIEEVKLVIACRTFSTFVFALADYFTMFNNLIL